MLTTQSAVALADVLSVPSPAAPWPGIPDVSTIGRFATLVMERADLSRAASRVAVEEAMRGDVKDFARYELVEAETIVAVLEDLGTPVPQMGGEPWGVLAEIINTPAGRAFDTAYISAEYENHVFLRDLTAAYLNNSNSKTQNTRERYGRQLARGALFAFTEHGATAQKIRRSLVL